jgi:hypothetical protein
MARRYTVESVGARRELVILGAVAAAVLIAIVAFAAAGTSVRNQQTTPTPTPTPQPTPAAERDLFGGSLEPGVRYHTRAFIPALSFEVADTEWIIQDATQPNVLTLERRNRTSRPGSERPPDSFLMFSRITDVYDPRTGRVEVAPADLHAWMRRHPDLRVGASKPVTVAGVPGESFRVAVRFRRPAVASPECRRLLLTCTAINPQRYFPDGTQMRTIMLRTEPDPLVIDLIGNAAAIDSPAVLVLRSLRIGVR